MESTILKMWNKYKPRLDPKIFLLVSAQEAFYRKEITDREKRVTFYPRFINTGRVRTQDDVSGRIDFRGI